MKKLLLNILIGTFFTGVLVSAQTIYPVPFLSRISANDTTPNYLLNKLVAGSNIILTKNNAGGNETITIASTGGGSMSSSTIWGLFSNTATGLTYNNGNGQTSLTSGYIIPLSASTTQWNQLYNASTSYVPYTGATANVNLGSNNLFTTGLLSSTSTRFTNSTTTSQFVTDLTALQAVLTDANKKLISYPYATVNTGSTLVARDSNGNSAFVNVMNTNISTVTSGQTIAMTAGSGRVQRATGGANITYNLPDATNLIAGTQYEFDNDTTGTITIQNNGAGAVGTVVSGGYGIVTCTDNTTTNGAWNLYFSMPSNSSFGTAGLSITGTLGATGTSTLSTTTINGAYSAFGALGVGTTTPQDTVQVVGGITGSSINAVGNASLFYPTGGLISYYTSGLGGSLRAYTNGGGASGNLFINPTGGNVSVGSTTSRARFDVFGPTASFPGEIILDDNGANNPRLTLYKWTGTATNYYASRLFTTNIGDLSFQTAPSATIGSGVFTDRLTILNGGNVGIGSTTPGTLLSVQGDGYFGGNLTATGSLSLPTDATSIKFVNNGTNGQISSNGGAFTISANSGSAGADNFILSHGLLGGQMSLRSDITRFSNRNNTQEFGRLSSLGLNISSNTPQTAFLFVQPQASTTYNIMNVASSSGASVFRIDPSANTVAPVYIDINGLTAGGFNMGSSYFGNANTNRPKMISGIPSATAPAILRGDDLTTGLGLGGSGVVTLISNGIDALHISASGTAIGIGTSSPDDMLAIRGTTTQGLLELYDVNGVSKFSVKNDGNASSTASLSATNLYGNLYPTGLTNSFLAVDTNGKIISTTTPGGTTYTGTYPIIVTGSVISTGFSTSTTNVFSALNTFVNATSTNHTITGSLYDSINNKGTLGMVLQSTGTSTLWVATSSLGIIGGTANFSTTSINGFATTSFVFATTSTGTDFSISTTTTQVQFNTPSASASNRGFLTSTDWTTFNNKVSNAYASSTFASTSWVTATFVPYSYSSSTFPTFGYASSTFASTSWINATFPTYAYASSSYYLATNPSGFITNSVSNLTNYPTYTYASSTFASTSWILANYPNYSYASSTFASTSWVTATFAPKASPTLTGLLTFANASSTGVTTLGNLFTTATSTLATTSISKLILPNITNSFLAVDTQGNVIATTTPAGGSGYNTIATSTGNLTQRTTLKFLGSGISCVDGGASTDCTISTGGLSGGVAGKDAYWTSATTLGAGNLFMDGTVAGMNATTSSDMFTLKGTGNLNPFNVASSSGQSLFNISSLGLIGIGTTTADDMLAIRGTSTSNLLEAYASSGLSTFEINNLGNIGVSSTTFSARLAVNGADGVAGADAPLALALYAGNGGVTAGATGFRGGSIFMKSGDSSKGTASTNAPGVDGGDFTLFGGNGSQASDFSSGVTGGKGGSFLFTGGIGGADGASSIDNGGIGGGATIQGGKGGNATTFGGIFGGQGGIIQLLGGTGGDGTYFAGSNGGKGGDVVLTGGQGGSATSLLTGKGGDVILNGGLNTGTSTVGNIILANLRGFVGIGTTTPISMFHVVGTSTMATTTISQLAVGRANSATDETMDILGTFAVETAPSVDALIIDSVGLTNIVKSSTTDASTTNMTMRGYLADSTNNDGSLGDVLTSTGTSTLWKSTSTLGLMSFAYASSTYASTSWITATFAPLASPSFTGVVGIGTTTANSPLTVIGRGKFGSISGETGITINGTLASTTLQLDSFASTTDSYSEIIHRHSSTTPGGILFARSYAETSAHTSVPSNTNIGQIDWSAVTNNSNTSYNLFARILAVATGTISNTSSPGALVFQTTPTATVTPTEKFRINPSGLFTVSTVAPTIASSTGIGSASGTRAFAGNATAGFITITTGNAPAINANIVTMTLPESCPTRPIVTLSDATSTSAGLAVGARVFATSTAGNTWSIVSGTTALTGTTTYLWNYHVLCY